MVEDFPLAVRGQSVAALVVSAWMFLDISLNNGRVFGARTSLEIVNNLLL